MSTVLLRTLYVLLVLLAASPAQGRGPWRAHEENTAGWSLMTPEERIEHQAGIRRLKSFEECQAFRQRHHELMAERARAEGRRLGIGRRNYCEQMFPRAADR